MVEFQLLEHAPHLQLLAQRPSLRHRCLVLGLQTAVLLQHAHGKGQKL